ncbi:MAG: hypothetical protein V2J51_00415 [Erythrobacter sp.]|jgi:hypothetical protein|nr:hypothetical protein [Erythrobacter sp.]
MKGQTMGELSHRRNDTATQYEGRGDVRVDVHRDVRLDWRKAMSDHVAYALLVYTALHIFLTVKALSEGFASILPYVALVVLVAAIIPACRWFEKRWTRISDDEAHDPALRPAFRRDAMGLWMLAILLPLTLTLLAKVAFAGS